MTDLGPLIERRLQPLIGLPLSIVRRAADMRIFHFGAISFEQEKSFGQFALHLQCPWRIDQPDGIVTGHADLWCPIDAGADIDWDAWDYDADGNLQDFRLAALFRAADSPSGVVGQPADYIVHALGADGLGGLIVRFGERYTLRVFPSGSCAEDWRFFAPGSKDHVVIIGGRLEQE